MNVLITALMLVASASAGPSPLDEAVAAARRDHPELVQRIESLQPVRMRSGHTMLPTDADPRMAPVHLELALRPDLPADVRAAHARLGAEVGELALVRGVLQAGSPDIRASLHAGLLRSKKPEAVALLVTGVDDADVGVRTVALSVLSRHPEAARQIDVLVRATGDAEADVRRLAVRGVGWHGTVAQLAAVERLLHDTDPRVREAALSAMASLDEEQALEVAPQLLTDPDPRVRASAERLKR